VSRLLQVVFAGNRKTGQVDLEAIEMLVRDSMHRAGAAALERLLSMPAPQPSQVSCDCGHTAQYHDKRSKQLLTALGPVRFHRPTMSARIVIKGGSRATRNSMWWARSARPECSA
jgi:hypothetical protein